MRKRDSPTRRSPQRGKKKKSKHRSRSNSPKRTKLRHREKRTEDEDDLYEPDSGNDDLGYVPAVAASAIEAQEKEDSSEVNIPQEYSDISTYMTQVLETMMERQRLEMHKKLNEMFKTYFDAKTNANEDDDIDAELNELRQAAIQSVEKESTEKPVTFDNFHQFKKYKQKMRDQGNNLIVSIPNINVDSTILDQELDLVPKEKPETTAAATAPPPPTLQVKVTNDDEERTVLADGAVAPEKDQEKAKPVSKNTIKWTDLVYRDPCKHWCQTTSKWLSSFSDVLAHLHSEEYQAKMNPKEKAWKKRLEMFNATLRERDAIKESLKETVELAKGSEFFVPVQAFKCKLCEKIFRTEADAYAHYLGCEHNAKYDEFKLKNPNYEQLRLEKMQKSVAEKRKEIESQRRLAREKLQMRQLIKAKRNESSIIKTVEPSPAAPPPVAPAPSAPTQATEKPAGEKEPDKSENQENEETKKKPKPRSAALERILAMSKRKKKKEEDEKTEENPPPPEPVAESEASCDSEPVQIEDEEEKTTAVVEEECATSINSSSSMPVST